MNFYLFTFTVKALLCYAEGWQPARKTSCNIR